MILYRPTDGDVHGTRVKWRPRTCFVMAAMGKPIHPKVVSARKRVRSALTRAGYATTDASSETTGKDYLLKIWSLAVAAPVGIAIVHEGVAAETMANIYYELGWMHAYGRETVVIKIGDVRLPSDLVRTEYISFDDKAFASNLRKFISSLAERAEYYRLLADQLEKNPLLAIDYLRRSYLLSGDVSLRRHAKRIFDESGLSSRANDSVERNLVHF